MKEKGVFIAHCPESNMNLSSGIAPVRRYLEEGMRIGLGSDVAGGSTENLFRACHSLCRHRKCDGGLRIRWKLR